MQILFIICTLALCFVLLTAKNSLAADDCSAEAKRDLKWDAATLEARFGEPVFGVDRNNRESLYKLEPDNSAYVYVAACRPVNHSGIDLEKGGQYDLSFIVVERWEDKGLSASPENGVANPTFLMKIWTPFRRAWDHNWLVLLGGVSGDKLVPIAKGLVLTPEKSGEFISFANDAPLFYGNNTGEVVLKIFRKK